MNTEKYAAIAIAATLMMPVALRADQTMGQEGGTAKDSSVNMEKPKPAPQAKKKKMAKAMYKYPMDGYTSDKPGKCPQCGMDLVKEAPASGSQKAPVELKDSGAMEQKKAL